MPPKQKGIARRTVNPDEARNTRIVARITKTQRDEIADIAEKSRLSDSALLRMAAKKTTEELKSGKITVEELVEKYGPTT